MNPYVPSGPIDTRDPAREYDEIPERTEELAPLTPRQEELCRRLLRADKFNIEKWWRNE